MMELAGFHSGSTAASLHGPGLNPVGPEPLGGRILERLRRGRCGGPRAVCARLRDRRLDRLALGVLRRHGSSPDLRAGQPVRRDGARRVAGQGRADGTLGHGLRDCPRGPRRPRPPRSRQRGRGDDSIAVTSTESAPRRRRPWRLAYAPTDLEAAVEPIRPALQDARRVFEDAGVEFVEAELPADIPYLQVILDVLAGEGGANFADLIESDRFGLIVDPDQRARMQETLQTSARTYLEAMRMRRRIRDAFRARLPGRRRDPDPHASLGADAHRREARGGADRRRVYRHGFGQQPGGAAGAVRTGRALAERAPGRGSRSSARPFRRPCSSHSASCSRSEHRGTAFGRRCRAVGGIAEPRRGTDDRRSAIPPGAKPCGRSTAATSCIPGRRRATCTRP